MSIIAQALEQQEGVISTRVALESQGIRDQQEEEITIYAKIGNMEGLTQASMIEPQEQAEVKTPRGRIRIRKITLNGRQPVLRVDHQATYRYRCYSQRPRTYQAH